MCLDCWIELALDLKYCSDKCELNVLLSSTLPILVLICQSNSCSRRIFISDYAFAHFKPSPNARSALFLHPHSISCDMFGFAEEGEPCDKDELCSCNGLFKVPLNNI